MTSNLLGPSSSRATRAARRDLARVTAIEQRVAAGESLADATWAIISDTDLGYGRFRPDCGGRPRPTDRSLVARWTRLLSRAAPEAIEAARNAAQVRLAGAAGEAVGVIESTMRGDFGEARVRVKGRGEDAVETVEVDSGAARVRLEAAALTLRTVGLGDKGGGAPVAAVQVNVNGTDAQIARGAFADGETRDLATALSRRMARGPGGVRGAPDAGPVPDPEAR